MFSLSKGEPPTKSTTTNPSATEIGMTPCELPQLGKPEAPIRSQSVPVEAGSSTDQQQTESGVTASELDSTRTQSAPVEPDSGFEASPICLSELEFGSSHFLFDDDGSDEVFDEEESSEIKLDGKDDDGDDVFDEEEDSYDFLLEREDDDDRGDISSSSCSRAESSATVRAVVSSYTDPNVCDSDSSSRSSSPQSPPPSSWPIPASCSHTHNDRLPCPRCSGNEPSGTPFSSRSYLQNIVTSRSYPGSYPAALLNWWTRSSPSPRVAAALSRTSNSSDDRRSTRSRRREIDSDASSSSSCEGGSELEDLGTMTEAEELRVNSPEELPDLVPLSSESSSRRVRSQSVSIPLDQEYLREIGRNLRRLSNEFANSRHAQRAPRRSSLTSFLNWRS